MTPVIAPTVGRRFVTDLAAARAHYDRRRAAGDRHAAAQRNLFNRMLSALHHCLASGTVYNEIKAFPAAITTTRSTGPFGAGSHDG
ncbi:hypothetical protein [Micromonospora sp. NPDC051141]|uniref:hypothetical protein n=1 Tax=Micromonospora sp. NPDC051141 TaxID=3364284 RepID=UPI0037A414B5